MNDHGRPRESGADGLTARPWLVAWEAGASRRGHVDAAGVATMDGDGSDMRFNVPEPDCAPHPLDIMALYALYQTR